MNRFCRSVFALAFAAGCGGEASSQTSSHALGHKSEAIVYGEDNRVDVYAYPNASFRESVKASSVALIEPRFLQRPPSGRVTVSADSLQKAYDLCDSERFGEQPAGADCSATLIDDDLVLTAGHCFKDSEPCETYAYVFDYFYQAEGKLETLTAGDVFGCRDFVVRTVSPMGEVKQVDYAIIQLDRPALAPRRPVAINMKPLQKGESIVAIGFTSGLPAKIDDGAHIIDPRATILDYFKLDTDTFAGSSGSSLYNLRGELLGVLVRGGEDYERLQGSDCGVAVRIGEGEDGSPWEQATYVKRAIDALCMSGWPSERLCDIEPSCGDGFCTMDEVGGSCAVDCAASRCAEPPCAKSAEPKLMVGTPVPDPELVDGGIDFALAGKAPRSEACSASPASESGRASPSALALLALAASWIRRRTRRA